jgi:hypothetical protein
VKNIGNIGEATFIADATRHDLTVSQPFGDNAAYDFIVDNGDRLLRVQVKATDNETVNRAFKVNVTKGFDSRGYEEGDFDVLACYIIPLKIWFFMPFSTIIGKKTVKLCPFSLKSCKYDKYYDKWEIFN